MSLLSQASLCVTPNAYKEGKLYSVIPSDGSGDFTFTRATTATRVNSDGLVELVPYNLIRYTEDFSNVAWNKQNATISDNVTTAPDGTFTADKLVADATLAQHSIYQGGPSLDSGAYVVSCYAKAAEYSFFSMGNAGGVNGGAIIFNLTNGTFSGTSSGSTPSIESVGNGWYRCSIAFSSVTPSFSWWIIARNANNTSNYTGNGTDGLFVWGAQVVQGTSARDYLRTETRLNIPRLDYSLGGCPNILLEPQRTNLALQSSSFDNAAWTKVNATVTANYGISPDGTQNADRIQFTTSNSSSIYRSILGATTDANTIYVKGVSGEKVLFGYGGNVASGTLYTLNGDWQRLEQISTIGSVFHIGNYNGGNATDILIWGAQREAGSYATSYIPTTTASVTRNVDSITRNNIYTNGLITAAGGTWFVEIRNNRVLTRDAAESGLQFTDNSNIFGFRIKAFGTGRLLIAKVVGGAEATLYFTLTDIIKVAIKWNGSTADVFVNGVKVVAATAFTDTAMQSIYNNNTVPKYLNQMALFPTPLTDEQCSILTSDSYPTAAAAYASLGLVSESPSCLTSTTTF